MAEGFIGMTVEVKLKQPPNTVLHGKVTNIIAGQTLSLQDGMQAPGVVHCDLADTFTKSSSQLQESVGLNGLCKALRSLTYRSLTPMQLLHQFQLYERTTHNPLLRVTRLCSNLRPHVLPTSSNSHLQPKLRILPQVKDSPQASLIQQS